MKKIIAIALAAMTFTAMGAVSAKSLDKEMIKTVNSAVKWQESETKVYSEAGTLASDLYVTALSRLGIDYNYKHYASELEKNVRSYNKNTDAATYAHTLLAAKASDGNVQYFNGRDYVAEGTYFKGNISGIDNWCWALIALDSGHYEVPEWAYDTREDMVKYIMAQQNEDGSFGKGAGSTALAIIAMKPYVNLDTKYTFISDITGEDTTMTAAASVTSALNWLSETQSGWGDYYTLKDTALVMIALDYLDIDSETDRRYMKAGKSVLDGLMIYRESDGGFSNDLRSSDEEATAYAILALSSHIRKFQGKTNVFDLVYKDMPEGITKNIAGGSATLTPATAKPKATTAATAKPKATTKASTSSGSVKSTTKPASTTKPTTTMTPAGSPNPSATPRPTSKPALVGPLTDPGPMPTKTPEIYMDEEEDNSSILGTGDIRTKTRPIGIGFIVLAFLITALGTVYVAVTGKEMLKKVRHKSEPHEAKIHRRTEIHGSYKARERYRERGRYKGSYRK